MGNIETIKIENTKGLELEVLNYGATIKSLKVPNKYGSKTNIVVGLKESDLYAQSSYKDEMLFLGSSIGRFAGRISCNPMTIENKKYDIPTVNGVHLHGGENGFDKKYWNIGKVKNGKSSSITLSYLSKHLEEGYPGNLKVEVKYELHKSNALRITYKATTDRATYVNLTSHAYFNLKGKDSILDHVLKINSAHHLGVNKDIVPTGEILDSENSRYDFSRKAIIGREDFIGFDDTFILKKDKAKAASLTSKESGIKMEVYTNQPAVVVYTPREFPKSLFDSQYSRYPAICFETQGFPDSPNNTNFPPAVLLPGKTYMNRSVFNFEVVS